MCLTARPINVKRTTTAAYRHERSPNPRLLDHVHERPMPRVKPQCPSGRGLTVSKVPSSFSARPCARNQARITKASFTDRQYTSVVEWWIELRALVREKEKRGRHGREERKREREREKNKRKCV